MAQFRTSRTFDVIFLLCLGGFLWWATLHRTAIGDQVYFWHYHPAPRVMQVAQAAGLTADGQRLLYRTNPQFVSAADITADCDTERLGCLSSRGQAFVLDQPGQSDQTTVTATHEMLHLAYRRLSSSAKADLAPLLDQAITQNAAAGLQDELKTETSLEDRRDEAHSLLGTEYPHLPAALERYYAQYFTNRALVVAAAQRSQN